MVAKSLIQGSINGVGKYNKTSIFPCAIFQYMKGVNDKPGTPNYDLFRMALKSTTKRIYPNYANCDWSNQMKWFEKDRQDKIKYLGSLSNEDYNTLKANLIGRPDLQKALGVDVNNTIKVYDKQQPDEIFSTMGCRTANGHDINFIEVFKSNIDHIIKGEYDKVIMDYNSAVLKDGRGNICPVTIILPTIAMEAKLSSDSIECTDEEREEIRLKTFFDNLDKKIYEAKDMLIERFNWICSQHPASAQFMYENHTMGGYDPEEGIKSALKHGTLALGQLGVAETLQLLIGCDHTTTKGMNIAKKIENLFSTRINEFKNEYHLNFGVYYTPAENLCHTALKKFREKYGEIPNVSDKDYFTNSIHVPVWHDDIDCFKKIDIESQLTGYSTAGCITYVELPSTASNNIEAIEEIVTYAMEHDIPYFALNVPLDHCSRCNSSGDFNGVCPVCGNTEIEELRRVTGYLSTTVKNFNYGKQMETKDREKHVGNELNIYE